MATHTKPPTWFLWLFAVSLVVWPALIYWLANEYSGWSELKRYHDAGSRTLHNSQGPTHVTLVQRSGRKYDFGSRRSGRSTYARTDVGFDEEGFWVRGRHGGWTGGPRGAVFISWFSVARCEGLRIHLTHPDMALIVQDQPVLDACVCALRDEGCRTEARP